MIQIPVTCLDKYFRFSHVDDIDLYPGAMTETHLPGSFLGPTFTCLMAEQFRDLKEGDRFWYETPKKGIRFTRGKTNRWRKQLSIKILKLGAPQIIYRNCPKMKQVV